MQGQKFCVLHVGKPYNQETLNQEKLYT